jgi:hypothetical protein
MEARTDLLFRQDLQDFEDIFISPQSAATAEVNLLREITINGFSMENSG